MGVDCAELSLVCKHQPQNPRGEQNTEQRESHDQTQRHQHGGMHGFFDPRCILCAEMLRNDDARAACKTGKKPDEDIDDRSDASDGGVCFVDACLPDDPGIHHIVKLLKQVADEQRQRKKQQIFGDRAFCHIKIAVFAQK